MLAILVIIMCICTGVAVHAQTAIKVAPKAKTEAQKTKLNSQGFALPLTVPDTTMVYESSRGSQYYWRLSKKSQTYYKVYMYKSKKKGQ